LPLLICRSSPPRAARAAQRAMPAGAMLVRSARQRARRVRRVRPAIIDIDCFFGLLLMPAVFADDITLFMPDIFGFFILPTLMPRYAIIIAELLTRFAVFRRWRSAASAAACHVIDYFDIDRFHFSQPFIDA
jgi:hypothetical protein